MTECEGAMRQLWDYLDSELTAERMDAVRAHLAICSKCYPHYDFEKIFLEALAATRRDHASPEQLRERVMDALRAEGFAAV